MKLYLLFTCCFLCHNLTAQRLLERNVQLVPLADTTNYDPETGTSWAHSLSGWAGFGRYVISDNDHAWVQELGLTVELVRFSHKASLAFTTQIEFIADPNNNINFNPRAIFWSEGIFYMRRKGNSYWRAGYYHRCKHDIDNLNLGVERTLIFGSLMAERSHQLPSKQFKEAWLGYGADLYTIRQDDRFPQDPAPGGLNTMNLLSSFSFKSHVLKAFPSEKAGIYANAFLQANVYSANTGFTNRFSSPDRLNAAFGISAGLALIGNAQIRLGFNYEYLPDSGIPLAASGVHLFGIEIKGLNSNMLK